MYYTFFKDESMTIQAQLLPCLINSRMLKDPTTLLGIQNSTKDTKVKHNVFENITSVLKDFEKYQKKDVSVACRVIQTTIVSSSNIKNRLTHHMKKTMGTSRKQLHKHRKF